MRSPAFLDAMKQNLKTMTDVKGFQDQLVQAPPVRSACPWLTTSPAFSSGSTVSSGRSCSISKRSIPGSRPSRPSSRTHPAGNRDRKRSSAARRKGIERRPYSINPFGVEEDDHSDHPARCGAAGSRGGIAELQPARQEGIRHRRLARHRPGDRPGTGLGRSRRRHEFQPTGGEHAEEVCRTIRELGRKAESYAYDIAHLATTSRRCVRQVKDDFETIDILVNNAGITRDRSFKKMDREAWDEVINTNLLERLRLVTRQFIDGMAERGWGRVINISSIVGEIGNFGQANYAAAKAGMIGLTKTLAREYARKGVTVNAIAPGFIQTRMTADVPAKAIEAVDRHDPCRPARRSDGNRRRRALPGLARPPASSPGTCSTSMAECRCKPGPARCSASAPGAAGLSAACRGRRKRGIRIGDLGNPTARDAPGAAEGPRRGVFQRRGGGCFSVPQVVEHGPRDRRSAPRRTTSSTRKVPLKLLHYRRETPAVYAEPVLVCYALVNRPYILDLQPDERGPPAPGPRLRGLPDRLGRPIRSRSQPDPARLCRRLHEGRRRLCPDARADAGLPPARLLHGRHDVHAVHRHPPRTGQDPDPDGRALDFGGERGLIQVWTDAHYFDVDALIDTYRQLPRDVPPSQLPDHEAGPEFLHEIHRLLRQDVRRSLCRELRRHGEVG